MAYEVYLEHRKYYRVVLKELPEGVYVYVYASADSMAPEYDYLQDDYDMAITACEEDYGIAPEEWRELPDSAVP